MLDISNIPPILHEQPVGVYYVLHEPERHLLTPDEVSTIMLAVDTYHDPIDALIAALESGVFAPIYDRICQASFNAWALANCSF